MVRDREKKRKYKELAADLAKYLGYQVMVVPVVIGALEDFSFYYKHRGASITVPAIDPNATGTHSNSDDLRSDSDSDTQYWEVSATSADCKMKYESRYQLQLLAADSQASQ